MKHRHQLLLLLTLTLFACRTPRYMYSPAPPNTPFFKEKGESKFSAYYSGRVFNNRATHLNQGYDLQGAYAITDHFAITGSYSQRKERDRYQYPGEEFGYRIFDTSLVRYNRNMTEIGGGYFGPLDKSDEATLNIYGGIGFGKFRVDDTGLDHGTVYSRFYKANLFKAYVQPGINLIPEGNFSLGLSSRFSYIHYGDVSTSYTEDELYYFRMTGANNKSLFMWEPSWSVQFTVPNMRWLKIETGGVYGIKLSTSFYGRTRLTSYFVGVTFDPFDPFRK